MANLRNKIEKLNIYSKACLLFISLTVLCIILRVISCMMPESFVKGHVAAETYSLFAPGETLLEDVVVTGDYDKADFFTESKYIANAYLNDSNHPFKEAASNGAHAYPKGSSGPVDALYRVIETGSTARYNYSQLWFGAMVILRPMLVFFTYSESVKLLKIIISLALIMAVALLAKRTSVKVAMTFALSLLLVNIDTGLSLFHTATVFLVAAVCVMLATRVKNDEDLILLMTLSGVLTSYFDWQSTPCITFGYPMIVTLYIFYKSGYVEKITDGFISLIKAGITWILSYGLMQAAKWVFASIVLRENIIKEGLSHMGGDVNKAGVSDVPESFFARAGKALFRNFKAIEVVNAFGDGAKMKLFVACILICVTVIIVSVVLFIKRKSRIYALSLMTMLAAAPGVLYIACISGFCIVHWWFAYRGYGPLLMALMLAVSYLIDSNKNMNN